MSEKIASIHGGRVYQKGDVSEGLVETLRSLVGMAERGELKWFEGTGLLHDGVRVHANGRAGDVNVYSELGAIEWLKMEYVDTITGKKA